MLTAISGALAPALLLAVVAVVPQQPPNRCEVGNGIGQCLVDAIDPGRPGGPRTQPRRSDSDRAGDRGRASTEPVDAEPPPPPLIVRGPIPGALGQGTVPAIPADPAPPAPATDPAVVAQQAIELLDLRGPQIRMSATGTAFIGVPLWLWIDQGPTFTGPLSATAAAGTATVTATGRLLAVEWSLGPPGARVRCAGPGTPWTGEPGPSPDCGYSYEQRSLPERTNGTGRWPVTATSVWQVDWAGTSAGAPVTGTETVRIPTETSLAVGEIQVLVTGS
ncbi:hypothetical protein [Pseudonocardia lacus]|uniref:hypothetical protein n=1 Tax=Pseudonocardia lacus TaxID=2835865 RepID=UPI001BDD5B8B|nr:hypothetical protein [Pseudonocardia lacus]